MKEVPPLGTKKDTNRPAEQTTIVVQGGLTTGAEHYIFYKGIPSIDKDSSPLPPRDRYNPAPMRGLGGLDEMQELVSRYYDETSDRAECKLALVGHSLGALFAVRAALEKPDIFSSITLLAGAHEGIKRHTLGSKTLDFALKHPPEADKLRHDSTFMQDVRNAVECDWPADVPLRIYSTFFDQLIRPPQGFGLRPNNRAPDQMGLIVSYSPWPLRNILSGWCHQNIPEGVELIETKEVVDHFTIPFSRVVLGRIALHCLPPSVDDPCIAA